MKIPSKDVKIQSTGRETKPRRLHFFMIATEF